MEDPRYATTVIGAYSVPDWYEALDRLVAVGQLSMGIDGERFNFAPARRRSSIRNTPGIDIITGGEMHRRTHNRHSPPNAMLNYFWQKFLLFRAAPSRNRSRLMIRTSIIRRLLAGHA